MKPFPSKRGTPRAKHRASLESRADRIRTPISRRSVLKGLSAGALCLTLPVWRRMEAEAATSSPAKRFISFFTPNGTVRDSFFPAAGASPTSSPILAPLRALDAKLLVLKGVHMDSVVGSNKPGGPHMKGPGAMLTGGWLLDGSFTGAGGPAGYARSISVDQELAKHIGDQTPFPSLEFGVRMRGQEPLRYISYRGANQPNPAVDDPWKMYERVFSNFTPDSEDAARVRREKQTVLDYVKGELGALSPRLPAEDRPRLEAHLTNVRNIERQLDSLGQCEVPSLGERFDVSDNDNFDRIGALQMDLLFQAHACDLTRVSTFMWSNADSWQRFPWIGITREHHELSHQSDADSVAQLVAINTWYSEQLASFLAKLEATPDGEGSMLDNSLVLCGNEIGQGRNHTHRDVPWLIAGSAGGQIATGTMLEYQDQPHNNLLLSVLHAFGVEATSFGAEEHCTGPLPGLLG